MRSSKVGVFGAYHKGRKMAMRAGSDKYPFAELGLNDRIKITNPHIFKQARQAAKSYEYAHSNFKFCIYEDTYDVEKENAAGKIIVVQKPVLYIHRVKKAEK